MLQQHPTIESRLSNIEMLLLNLQNFLASLATNGSETSRLLNLNEACKYLGMPKSTLYGKVQRGEIAYSKPGKHLYFAVDDLIEYQKKNRRKTVAEIQAEARKGVRRG